MATRARYPLLSQAKVDRLVRKLETPGIKASRIQINHGRIALNIDLNHQGRGPLDPAGISGHLEIAGFEYSESPELDRLFGNQERHYLFRQQGHLWLAEGTASYHQDWTGIAVAWNRELTSPEEQEVLAYSEPAVTGGTFAEED